MSKYEEALAALNNAQKLAVTTTEGPVLVIAGPGTGKTQLLTTRIAHILATTDTLPQNVLCLTFTDSAAQTMRERLSAMVGKAAYDVSISTYHAFGSELIRRFPDYFLEDDDLQPVDDLGMDRIFRDIIANLPYSNPLKHADMYLQDIKTLVSDAKRALLTPDDLRKIGKANLTWIGKANPVVSETLGVIARIDKKNLPLFTQLAKVLPPAESNTNQIPTLAELCLSQLQEAVDAAEVSGKTATITAWKNDWLAKDNAGHFIVDGLKVNQKLLAAADIYEHYLQALKTRGFFDYDDMILRAVRALEANNDFRYTLQEQYQYILLDEFQDTNGAQLRLVELLTDNPVHEGRPNVLAVGDDDQAIYAFQGANYSHMLQFNDLYRDVLVVPLTENYRSHPDILQTARGIAEQVEERLHHHFPKIEKTLLARAKHLPERAVVERREARSDVMEFAWVARHIETLIQSGVPANEIAVLAPQHKYLMPLVPFLQTAGIAVRYDKRENVLDDPAIIQLLHMAELTLALSTGDQARANALWAEVLSFDFWNLSTSQIWRLSWQATSEARSWTEELLADETLQPIALFFVRLSLLAKTETLETLFDYLIGSKPCDMHEPGHASFTSPFYTHYFGEEPALREATSSFWELLSNLIVLRARLREYHKDGDTAFILADLLDFVAAHRAADIKILNTSPYASGAEAVQLMTAFKAKGMEFGAVFVLAVQDEAWGSKARRMGNRLSLPPNLQFIRYAGATNDERLRLFYVAITRAKSQLYLTSYTHTYGGKSLTRLKYLDESENSEGMVVSPLLPENSNLVLPAEEQAPSPTTELAGYWQQRHEAALDGADAKAMLVDRLRDFQLSPTHINDFVDVVNCGPQAFFMRTILRFPQAPQPQIHYGNAMHETLEWIHVTAQKTGTVPTIEAVQTTFARKLHAKHLSEQDNVLFLERGQLALEVYMAQRASAITIDTVNEYSFKNEGVFIGKAHLGGKIDKLIIDRAKKEVTIVDYKTGKSHTRWTNEVKLHKYRQQLYLYKALVEGSHTFRGYKVVDAYLDFVEPDEDGTIQSLHVQFDDTEFMNIKKLAEVIWDSITTVHLPDISGYSQDLRGLQAFEADLISDQQSLV